MEIRKEEKEKRSVAVKFKDNESMIIEEVDAYNWGEKVCTVLRNGRNVIINGDSIKYIGWIDLLNKAEVDRLGE